MSFICSACGEVGFSCGVPSVSLTGPYCSQACRGQRAYKRGPSSPRWRGGRTVRDGYPHVYMPEHPDAHGTGYIAEHRLVMERHIGRRLLPHENVHHKNGDKSDSRIENLELWAKPQPSGQRPLDLVRWAVETYPAEARAILECADAARAAIKNEAPA